MINEEKLAHEAIKNLEDYHGYINTTNKRKEEMIDFEIERLRKWYKNDAEYYHLSKQATLQGIDL